MPKQTPPPDPPPRPWERPPPPPPSKLVDGPSGGPSGFLWAMLVVLVASALFGGVFLFTHRDDEKVGKTPLPAEVPPRLHKVADGIYEDSVTGTLCYWAGVGSGFSCVPRACACQEPRP